MPLPPVKNSWCRIGATAGNENGLRCRKPMKNMELAKGIEPPTG
ncbi:MAG: hypothetical protein ABTR27_06015 [Candidatus Competibacter phosphatis]